ncbi:hypothetical protein [Halalkalibacter oceani]|uniref:Uncharacterized protein n=1 Tax=Halalkalibacter oceani TaxID=1653776 RepID=A0A9X2IPW8_9BACI|nr:hypothetical protein [Halalkalibacter oceani]MCM3714862.1 hypothetical protein [Halalkalibacter oceani]
MYILLSFVLMIFAVIGTTYQIGSFAIYVLLALAFILLSAHVLNHVPKRENITEK